jgi:prepilin-type N-terminal cleavage/methylation domain-containing protein
MLRARARDEHGFTILETLVAMVILVVGLMGTLKLVDAANGATASTQAREQGVALQRQLVEAARSLSYSDLVPTSVVGLVRATPGFADSNIGAQGWQIVRRGVTYHMTIGVCIVDDGGDGIGTHDAATFCADGAGATTAAQCRTYLGAQGSVAGTGAASGGAVGDCGLDVNLDGRVDGLTQAEAGGCAPGVCTGSPSDSEPDDLKRIVTLVRWSVGRGTRYALQSTLLPYPGFAGAPRVLSLDPRPSLSATSTADTAIGLRASTDRKAASVAWLLNGTPAGTATDVGGGVVWDLSWPLGQVGVSTPGDRDVAGGPKEVLDGVYQLSARAYDTYGANGSPKTQAITVNRRQPYAPSGFDARRVGTQVQTIWQASREGDVLGDRLYRRSATGTRSQVPCSTDPETRATSCTDANPPSTGTYTYVLYAVDVDNASQKREGDPATPVAIPFDNKVPSAPGSLTATRVDSSTVKLTWDNKAKDQDGTIVSYSVYRDGTSLSDAIGTTATTSFTDTTAGGGTHTYYVSAVDEKGAESSRTSGAFA